MHNEKWVTQLLFSRWGKWLWLWAVVATIIAAVGLKNMSLASDYKVFFDEDDTGLQLLEQMQNTYTTTENVFIMVESPSDIYNQKSLSLLHEMTEQLWLVPHVTRVDSLTNYPHSSADGDDIVIEEFLFDRDDLDPQRINFIKQHAPKERELLGSLITEDGRYSAINATVMLPGINHKAEILSITHEVDELIAQLTQRYPEHHFYVTGIIEMNGAFFKAAKQDFVTLIPLMMLFVLLAAGIILGSLPAAGAILLLMLLSALGSLGLAGWLGIKLSAPSVSAPIIMFTVIVASSIHIISYIKRQVNLGMTQKQAVEHSYQRNIKPVIISHLTTIIGFIAMNSSDSPPFRDLGNIVALGVAFSLLLSLTVLPQLLMKITLDRAKGMAYQRIDHITSVSSWIINSRKWILFVMVPFSLLLASMSFHNELNDNLIKYFSESVDFRADTEEIDRHFSGIYNIDYSLSSGKESGIFQSDFLEFLEAFDRYLLSRDEVVITDSPLHRIKLINRLMNGDDDAFYRLPDNPNLAAQHFLLYEMSLPFGKDFGNQVSFDKSSLKITARLNNMSSQQVIRFEESVEVWLQKNQVNGISIIHSSPAVIFSHIGETSIISLLQGASLAFLVISIALAFVFRSLYIGALSLIPNLLPVGAAFGVWYFLQGEISMGLAGVSAMVIGIIVDDTVHFLYHYVDGLKRGLTPEQSVQETFDKTVKAIIISSVLLVIGFLLLATSSFEKNAMMGILTSMTIVFALLFDLLLLPALVLTFLRRLPGEKPGQMTMADESI